MNKSFRFLHLPPIPWTYTLKRKMEGIQSALDYITIQLYELLNAYEKKINEYKNEIQILDKQLYIKEHQIEAYQQINTGLYNELEDRNEKLELCINAMTNTTENDEELICMCCCIMIAKKNIIKCSNDHNLCKVCVNSFCKETLETIDFPTCEIKCLSMTECDGYICMENICKTFYGKQMIKEYHFEKSKDTIYKYFQSYSSQEIDINFSFLKSNGSFRALQCPVCDYGPILHMHCPDLYTHHGQQVDENSFVSNECPRCKFMGNTIFDFRKWSGRKK